MKKTIAIITTIITIFTILCGCENSHNENEITDIEWIEEADTTIKICNNSRDKHYKELEDPIPYNPDAVQINANPYIFCI